MPQELQKAAFSITITIVTVLAAVVLLLVPAHALIGATAIAFSPNGPTLLLAWGNDGGCPALALLGGLEEAPNEPIVFLPGSSQDGVSLRVSLQNLGVDTIAALFMPTGAPFPRGANSLLKELKLRRFVVAEDARSRTDWKPVLEKATELGAMLERIQEENGRMWHADFSQWNLKYQKLPESEIRGILKHDGQEEYLVFEKRVTGEFVILHVDSDGNSHELFCQPHTNRNGSVRIKLPF